MKDRVKRRATEGRPRRTDDRRRPKDDPRSDYASKRVWHVM